MESVSDRSEETKSVVDLDLSVRVARAEIKDPQWALTEQYLAVHEVVRDRGEPVVVRIDADTTPDACPVYFALEDQPYYLVIVVEWSPAGEASVEGVYVQAKVHARLVVTSPDLTPEVLASRIGVDPTTVHRRGEPRGPRGIGTHEQNVWILEPQAGVPGSVEEKLKVILDLARPVVERIAALPESCAVEVLIAYYGWGGDPQFGGFHLDAAQVNELAALGAEIDFDLYALGPKMPEDM